MMTPCAPVLTGLPLSSAASTLSSTMLELARSEPWMRTPTMSGTASSMSMSSAPPASAVPRYHTCDAHRLPPSSMCHLSPLPRASPTAHCTQRVKEPSQHSLRRWRLLSVASNPTSERSALEARQPHGRLVDPQEIADAVAYLASPASRSTTGVSLAIDGGMQELRVRPRG